MKKKYWIIAAVALVAIGVALYLFLRPNLSGEIVIPYIAHQKPTVDPHIPAPNPLSDKLDEVTFDGLFDLSANPSGVVYEDGLGELLGIDNNNVVTVRLKTTKRWHDTYQISADDDKYTIRKGRDHFFSARDVAFTLKRIEALGSLSPDYILVSQAFSPMVFEGPDDQNRIRFGFRGDRIWKEADIKEVLSFKILPDNSDMNALTYSVGTTPYMALPPKEGVSNYFRTPDGTAQIPNINLAPFVDNSTYTTELRNNTINVVLESPFGGLSPILADNEKFFTKSNIATAYFALFFNTERLTRPQRIELRKLINNKTIIDRFFKVGSGQERHITDYKGNKDNFYDYLNHSVFPSTSYYVEEKVVEPATDTSPLNLAVLPDTIRIKTCLNYGFREEYSELIDVLNDPTVTGGRIKVTAVGNDEIRRGDYDAVLVAISGYRSNFLFDLYNVFLREPDLQTYRINLQTEPAPKGGLTASLASMQAERNFFRLDPQRNTVERDDIAQLLKYVYGFMATRQIGDKQEYARRVDILEHSMALGSWLFSLPSLAYFTTQFDSTSIDLYGVASQLSTIKKWREKK
jgi:hypothetical protein